MILKNAMTPRSAAERRSVSWEEATRRFREIFLGGGDIDTGMSGAEKLSPVAAAHRILCNDFGLVPFSFYRRDGEDRKPVDDEALRQVFKVRPNPNMTPYMLGRTVMSNAFWHGFGAVWNIRDDLGRIIERVPLPSECCSVRQDKESGQYFYDYNVDGVFRTFTGYELSFLFFESYDGIRGRGLLDLARSTIATDGAAQKYGEKFYKSGAVITGIVEVDTDLNQEGRQTIKEQFANYSPFGDDAFKVAVLDRGYKYTPLGLSQKESQFIESRSFSVEEIARFTGVPQPMLQAGKEAYNSNAQQRTVFVTDTLLPYVTQWEQENTYKALSAAQRAQKWYCKGNLSALLRGDDAARSAFYEKMISNGVYNPDECRAMEEKNPIPGGVGKQFFITKNLGPIEVVAKGE